MLELLYPTNHISTRYLDNDQSSNLVINLIFFRYGLVELDNHTIHLEWRLLSDHTPLTITIPIEEYSENQRQSITKDSKEEKSFIKNLIKEIVFINTSNLSDTIVLKNIVELFTSTVE